MALARTLESFDPSAARRGLRRAAIADLLCQAADVAGSETATALIAAQLNEICLLVTHDRSSDSINVARAVLSGTVLRSSGLAGAADAVHHGFERWSGGGLPTGLVGREIPEAARILAAVHAYDEPTIASMGWLEPRSQAALQTIRSTPLHAPHGLDWLDQRLRELQPRRTAKPLEVTKVLSASHRVIDVVSLIAEQACDQLDASTISVARFQHAEGLLRVLVNVGELGDQDKRHPRNDVFPLSALPRSSTIDVEGARLLRVNPADNQQSVAQYLNSRSLSSEAVVPIVSDDSVWGIVWATTFDNHHRRLSEDDLERLRETASQLAVGIKNAELFAEFEDLALRDPLTGLWNRRILDQKLAKVFSDSDGPCEDAAVIICDVDELKMVNDKLGHSAGDAVLVEAAASLTEATTGLDGVTVCRIGGDEFSVVIEHDAAVLAPGIVEATLHRFRRHDSSRSMSCGIAITNPAMAKPGELMRAADEAQYSQKRRRKAQRSQVAPPERSIVPRRRARRDP
ncbi:MAG: diguanylate cyclase [Acidimicrobiales bacterium]